MLLRMSRTIRSMDHGGMLGRSIAKVMQLQAMKTKTIKSNQDLEVRLQQNCLNLWNGNKSHL